MKKTILFAIIILLIPLVNAACPGCAPPAGGNLTYINITGSISSSNWQGYAGIITYGTGPNAPTNVTAKGSNVTGQGIHFQIPCNNPAAITGFVLFSNSSSAPIGLVPGNLTQLDAYVPGLDNGTLTFTSTSTFNFPSAGIVAGVPTAYTFVNSAPQNTTFREGYFNDAAGNRVFATEINFVPPPGYNTNKFSYQIMLAAPNFTTVPYYIYADLTAVCPTPPTGGGGGGGAGRCEEKWDCTHWGPCINGIEKRNCTQTVQCPYYTSGYFPPTERTCDTPGYETPPTIPEEITIEEVPFEQIFKQTEITAPKIDLFALNPNKFLMALKNDNEFSLENLRLTIDIPEIHTKIMPIHHYKDFLWKSLWLTGWSLRPFREKNYPWKVKVPKNFRISPLSSAKQEITITSPAVLPQEMTASLTLLMGEKTIETINVPMQIKINEFDAGYSYDAEREIFALFFIIDNRGKPAKENAFIEFNLDSKLVEYYGPYNFPANEVTIMAQEYNIGSLKGEYELKAVLYDDTTTHEVKKQCIISE